MIRLSFKNLITVFLMQVIFLPAVGNARDFYVQNMLDVSDFSTGWQYIDKDIMRSADWDQQEWKKIDSIVAFETKGPSLIWQRVKLPSDISDKPFIYFSKIHYDFEIYLDRKLIYKYGKLDENGESEIITGPTYHVLEIPKGSEGKMLYVRAYSHFSYVGVGQMAKYGNLRGIQGHILSKDAVQLFSTAIYVVIAVICFVVFLFIPDLKYINYFSLFCLAIGSYIFHRTNYRIFLIPNDRLLHITDFLSAYTIPLFFCLLSKGFIRKWFSVIDAFMVFYVVNAVYSLINSFMGLTPGPLHSAYLIVSVLGISTLTYLFWDYGTSGHKSGKIIFYGMLIFLVALGQEVLQEMTIIPRIQWVFPVFSCSIVAVFFYVFITRVINQFIDAEKKIRSAEEEKAKALATRFESLKVFAKGVAHEINNPLAIISGNVQLLEIVSRTPDAGKLDPTSYVKKINTNVDRIKDVVYKLVTVLNAKVENSSEAVTLYSIRERLEKKLIKEFGSLGGFTMYYPSSNVLINGLPEGIVGAIFQIAKNGMESARESSDPSVKVRIELSDVNMKVIVTDNGRGIDSEDSKRIFDPFYSKKNVGEGMGLGLSIAYQYAVSTGGRVEVLDVDQGASILLEIPVKVVHKKSSSKAS